MNTQISLLAEKLRVQLADPRPPAVADAVLATVSYHDASLVPLLEERHAAFSPETQQLATIALCFLRDDITTLTTAALTDDPIGRLSPCVYARLRRVPEKAPALFAAWIWLLQKDATHKGASAFRTLLGDVSEAAFRSLQLGAEVKWLLGDERSALLHDLITAELPSTTDFIAARGMVWLLGIIGRQAAELSDVAASAIERSRARFRDASFQRDCDEMLTSGNPWPAVIATRELT